MKRKNKRKLFVLSLVLASGFLFFPNANVFAKDVNIGRLGDVVNVLSDELCFKGVCLPSWNWLPNGTSVYYNTGRVGIGTSTPGAGLHINRTDGFFTLGSVTFGGSPYIGMGTTSILAVDNSGNVFATSTTAITTAVGLPTSATDGQTLRYNNSSWVANSVLYNNGTNIGIGTVSPQQKLQVDGNIVASSTYPQIYVQDTGTILGGIRADRLAKLEIKTLTTAPLSFQVNSSEKMRIQNDGNVGIGTTNAFSKLSLRGSPSAPSLTARNASLFNIDRGDSGTDLVFTIDASTPFTASIQHRHQSVNNASYPIALNPLGGNVGIGTTSPTAKLSIDNAGTYSILAGLQRIGNVADPFEDSDAVNKGYLDTAVESILPGGASSTWGIFGTAIYNLNTAGQVGVGTGASALGSKFVVKGGGTTSASSALNVTNSSNGSLLFVRDDGNVGIGTTNPLVKLEITQSADNSGFKINGYDDQSTNNITLNLDASGIGQIDASGGWRFKYNGNNISYIDNSGANGFRFYNDIPVSFGTTANTRFSLGYVSSADKLQLSYGGGIGDVLKVKLVVNNLGNVGIGTTSPTAKLSIDNAGTYSILAGLQRIGNVADPFEDSDAVNKGYLDTAVESILPGGASSTWGIFGTAIYNLNTAGQVGVGTGASALGSKFVVKGGGTTSASSALNVTNSSNGSLFFVRDDGNVGIGTTNPTSKLQVSGGNIQLDNNQQYTIKDSTGVARRIALLNNSNILAFGDAGNVATYFYSGGNLVFAPNGDVRFPGDGVWKSGGNVGIGTTSPTAKLSIDNADTYSILAGLQRIGNVADPFEDSDAVNKGYLDTAVESILPGGASSTWGIFGTAIYNLNTAGQVGVGTGASALGSKFVVKGGGTTSASSALNITNSSNGSLLFVRDDGNVGVGTGAPADKLEVLGHFRVGPSTEKISIGGSALGFNRRVETGTIFDNTGHAYQFNHTKSTTAASDYLALQVYNTAGGNVTGGALVVNGVGNVGIGTTTPSQKFSVVGNAILGGVNNPAILFNDSTGSSNDGGIRYFDNNLAYIWGGGIKTYLDSSSGLSFGDWGAGTGTNASTIDARIAGVSSGTANNYRELTFRTGGAERVRISETGNVGIGTTTPTARLSVSNSATSYSILAGLQRIGDVAEPFENTDAATKNYVDSIASSAAFWKLSGNKLTASSTSWMLGIGTDNPQTMLTLGNNGWISSINSSGSGYINMFRVNTNNQIEVGGPLLINQFQFAADSGYNTFVDMPVTSASLANSIQGYTLKIDGENILRIFSQSNGSGGIINKGVGVNLAVNPGTSLDVDGVFRATAIDVGGFMNSPGIVMTNASGSLYSLATSSLTNLILPGSNEQTLRYNGSAWEANSVILNNGTNIGIGGAIDSLYKLKVHGSVAITGILQTQTGSDFAEEFIVAEHIPAGTVVSIGDLGYKSVKPSTKAYDKSVVGIVSDNPSIIAGRVDSEKKAIIAMSGVVTVKVVSLGGQIEKGDLLTSSDIPGYAMKAKDNKAGTIIGKALEGSDKRYGEVKVLVNLQ